MYLLSNSFVNSCAYPSFVRSWTVADEDAKIMAGQREILPVQMGCIIFMDMRTD